MKRRLPPSNELRDKFFPVRAYFDAIPDEYYIRFIEHMALGIGSNFNEVTCTFPDDLDDDEKFDGVCFSVEVLHEEIVVDYQTFYDFLKEACNVYIEDFPNQEKYVQEVLKRIAVKYNLIA